MRVVAPRFRPAPRARPAGRVRLAGAAAGILAAGFGIAVAELLAAAAWPGAGPLVAVGGAVIDATPTAVKEFAVRELGTHDKPVLLATIGLVLILFAATVGVLGSRRRIAVPVGAAVLGVAGAAAALSRPASSTVDAIPALLGAAIAGATLWWLLRRGDLPTAVPGADPSAPEFERDAGVADAGIPERVAVAPAAIPATVAQGDATGVGPADVMARAGGGPGPALAVPNGGDGAPGVPRPGFDRRRFLQAAALVGGGAAVAEGGARLVAGKRGDAADRTRAALRLPAAADPAKPLPAGIATGFVTDNADFYRVDTALTVPRIDPDTWSLRVHGMVSREVRLSLADLLDRPLIERDVTLNCVSNEVGGPYIGTARWLGVSLAALLGEVGVDPAADQLVSRSVDGMTIGTPVATVLDGRDAMLVVGMNGEPLPLAHGFPVRMLTPGLYGYAGACKWLTELELSTFDRFDAYWVQRGWAARGMVKTASRIDHPRPFERVAAGAATVAGVAWAQRRGISAVEVRVDDGEWRRAELLPVPSADTWVQWRLTWAATAGPHSLAVRATDSTGAVQTATRATPYPDGSTGHHTIAVTVS